jgi:hypothetical protein
MLCRTFTKSFNVVNIEELMKTNRFKYVIIEAGGNYYFGFDLLDEIECGCIFALILSRDIDSINGWVVSKNLPEWVGDYSEGLTYEKQHANDTRSHHKECEVNLSGEVFSIPGSISYSGGFDSD